MLEFNPEDEDPRLESVLNDRYRIIERIGAGGMAVVYRGERLELGRPVAIKFLQEVMLRYPKFISRFEAEAKAMSKLSHPYCVPVIDFGVDSAPYIVMDYVTGRTLKAVLREERFSVPRAITLIRQILAGISHAHGEGIIHRDIKPENIMLSEATGMGEHVRIFDFGLAKLLDTEPGLSGSTPSIVAGTPNYMSPEQSRGKSVDERTDLYSIGVVLYEMLSGAKPFVHPDFVEVVRMHRDEPPPTLAEMARGRSFSAGLEALVAKALSKSPDDRFQTADEFSEALNATREGTETKEISLPPSEGMSTEAVPGGRTFSEVPTMYLESGSMLFNVKRRLQRNKTQILVAAAILVVMLVAVGVILGSGSRDRPRDVAGTEKKGEVAVSSKKTSPREKGPPQPTAPTPAAGEDDTPATNDEMPEPVIVESIKDVRALIDADRTDDAIAGLRKLRREDPNKAYYVLLLANLFFKKGWWGDAIDYYREALRMSPSYKNRLALNNNLITALGANKTYRKASSVIQKSVGQAAVAHLRRASKRDKNPVVRKRAANLVKKLQK